MFRADEDGLMDYLSTQTMRAEQGQMKSDIAGPLNQAFRDMCEAGRDAAAIIASEFEEYNERVIDATPWHAAGPTDPPFHAAEVWKFSFRANDNDGFTLTQYNPKDYMPFLEEGWSPQAPAGWIAALWAEFVQKVDNV